MNSLRYLTYIFFAYTTVEGLVINMLYPNTLPFIFKDIIIGVAYLALMTETHGPSGTLGKLSGPLTIFAIVQAFFLVVPSQVLFLGEMVALKQRLFYIPLAWVGYHFMRSHDDLLRLIKWMAWTSIPACIFGIYLYFVGPSALAALGANYSAVFNSTAGEHGIAFWRVPGTFTSPGQYGGFLLVNIVLFGGVLFMPTKNDQRKITMIALVIAIGALMVSGSRSPLLLSLLCYVVMLVSAGRIQGIGVWAGAFYGIFSVGFSLFGDGVMDRVGSIASFEHVERFKDTYAGQLFWAMLLQSPMGFGLGRATLGARHFTDWSNIMLVESYFGIIAAETGIIGIIAFMVAIGAVLSLLIKCSQVMRGSPMIVLWYAVALPVVITAVLLPVGTAIDSAPGNLYFWFFLGIAIRMYDLELERRRSLTSPPPAAAGTQWAQLQRPVYPVSYQ